MKEGHLIILICILFYYFATHFYREKKYQLGVLFILGAVAVIRIYMGSHPFFMPWDERFHALVAKNMVDDPFTPMLIKNPVLEYDYKNWTINHIWLHKPPLGMWLIAISYKIFGFNVWALRFPSLVMSIITVFLIYKISEKLFSAKVGWLSALCFSLVALPITVSVGITCTDHIDTPFMCFITAGIYAGIVAVQKEKWWRFAVAGIFTGCAVLTKWLPGLIVIGVVGFYLMHHRKMGWGKMILYLTILTGTGVAVFMPWQLYIFQQFPMEATHEAAYNTEHIFKAIEGHAGSPWYQVDNLNFQWTPLIYLMIPLFLFLIWKNKLSWKGIAIAGWLLIPLIFFSFVKTKMPAYCLFIYPAVAICFGYCIDQLNELKGKLNFLWKLPAFVFFGLVLMYSIDFMRLNAPHMQDEYGKKETMATKTIQQMGKEKRDRPVVVFNTLHYIECMFYIKNCTAFQYRTDSATIVDLKNKGYEVMVYSYSEDAFIQQ
jgi:4-amino-4-deoxy-L-arabinose transferase-like glycosyltransferase